MSRLKTPGISRTCTKFSHIDVVCAYRATCSSTVCSPFFVGVFVWSLLHRLRNTFNVSLPPLQEFKYSSCSVASCSPVCVYVHCVRRKPFLFIIVWKCTSRWIGKYYFVSKSFSVSSPRIFWKFWKFCHVFAPWMVNILDIILTVFIKNATVSYLDRWHLAGTSNIQWPSTLR